MYFILTKTKLRIFVLGYKLKQSAFPELQVNELVIMPTKTADLRCKLSVTGIQDMDVNKN